MGYMTVYWGLFTTEYWCKLKSQTSETLYMTSTFVKSLIFNLIFFQCFAKVLLINKFFLVSWVWMSEWKSHAPRSACVSVFLHLLTWVVLFWLDRDRLLEVMPMFSPLSREWTTSSRKVIWIIDGSTFWGSST